MLTKPSDPKKPLPSWWNLINGRTKNKLAVSKEGKKWVIQGTSGADRIWLGKGANGQIDVYLNGIYQASVNESEIEKIIINGGDGDDHIEVDPQITKSVTIKGGDGNDVIIGGGGADRLQGGKGKDLIEGGWGSDILIGGDDNDELSGGQGNDRIYGKKGVDKLYGNEGTDFIDGGKGDDLLDGTDSKSGSLQMATTDYLHDYSGNNTIKNDTKDIVKTQAQTRLEKEWTEILEKKYGIDIVNSDERSWSEKELRLLEKTLASLPKDFLEAVKWYKFIRSPIPDFENHGYANPQYVSGVHRDGRKMYFYDWLALSNNYRGTIVHEMAHAYEAQKMTKDQIKEFNNISWGKDKPKTDGGFASDYGKEDPKEDWATSVELYFRDPDRLKQISLEKYNFIHNLFGINYRPVPVKFGSNKTPLTTGRPIYA